MPMTGSELGTTGVYPNYATALPLCPKSILKHYKFAKYNECRSKKLISLNKCRANLALCIFEIPCQALALNI